MKNNSNQNAYINQRGPLKLRFFSKNDFDELSKNIDSSLDMMIWAGPKYKYPLTFEQFEERMNKTINGKNKIYLFSLYHSELKQNIGFIEIEILDEEKKLGSIQSVLIYKDFRGRGYSETLLDLATNYSYHILQLDELELKVLSFNTFAMACYKKLGFIESDILDRANPKTGKSFQLFTMKKRLDNVI